MNELAIFWAERPGKIDDTMLRCCDDLMDFPGREGEVVGMTHLILLYVFGALIIVL